MNNPINSKNLSEKGEDIKNGSKINNNNIEDNKSKNSENNEKEIQVDKKNK